ncbi:MAG TPA: hypothetical protein PLD70_13140, partial [Thermotogota bacterium]|nr:hypothetical protein [Thermotogota bacterium]
MVSFIRSILQKHRHPFTGVQDLVSFGTVIQGLFEKRMPLDEERRRLGAKNIPDQSFCLRF